MDSWDKEQLRKKYNFDYSDMMKIEAAAASSGIPLDKMDFSKIIKNGKVDLSALMLAGSAAYLASDYLHGEEKKTREVEERRKRNYDDEETEEKGAKLTKKERTELKKQEEAEKVEEKAVLKRWKKAENIQKGTRVKFWANGLYSNIFESASNGTVTAIEKNKDDARREPKIMVLGDNGKNYTITQHELFAVVIKERNEEFVYPMTSQPDTRKSWKIALLLAFFFGIYGFDRFYLGYKKIGLLKLFTAGGICILWFYDFYRIATKSGFAAKVDWK